MILLEFAFLVLLPIVFAGSVIYLVQRQGVQYLRWLGLRGFFIAVLIFALGCFFLWGASWLIHGTLKNVSLLLALFLISTGVGLGKMIHWQLLGDRARRQQIDDDNSR